MLKMIGTTGSTYTVVAQTANGTVGIRNIDSERRGYYRIRIVPRADAPFFQQLVNEGWKKPGDNNQPRYSKMVKFEELAEVLGRVIALFSGVEIPKFEKPVPAPEPVKTRTETNVEKAVEAAGSAKSPTVIVINPTGNADELVNKLTKAFAA